MSPVSPTKRSFAAVSLLIPVLFGAALVVLALDPALWLVRSWHTPGYDSPGAIVFCLVVGLFFWSGSSSLQPNAGVATQRLPVSLLLLSFVVRLASQLLAINVLGALMLALDVFALALFLRLPERLRPVSPALVAALFCFALPLELILQRTVGFALQQASAAGACAFLSAVHESAGCEGVRLSIDSVDVLVDLPCSGARLLILLLTGFFALAAAKPLPLARAVPGVLLVVMVCWVANTLRIVLLAWGLRYAEVLGVDVMRDPLHSGIGLSIAAMGIGVLMVWLRRAPNAQTPASQPVCRATSTDVITFEQRGRRLPMPHGRYWLLGAAGSSLAVALLLISLRPSPVDVSRPLATPQLPLSLAGVARAPLPLSRQERHYFQTFGGAAARAGYGAHSLLLVRTTSPLRHLHSPDVCFSASGYEVTYVGVDFSTLPVAVYHTRSPTGEELRVRVQFVAASGRTAHSVSEVVWYWLRNPTESWTMVQTVSPWDDGTQMADSFRVAVARALNLGSRA